MTDLARKLPDDEMMPAINMDTAHNALCTWANENRMGRYENIGFPSKNILAAVGQQHGGGGYRCTLTNWLADQVESVIAKMRQDSELEVIARVLEAEYIHDRLPLTEKQKWVRRKCGASVSPSTFYKSVLIGKGIVYGRIGACHGVTVRPM